MNRFEQEDMLREQNLVMPELCDLTVAYAAYFLATGKGLLGGNGVRARGGALRVILQGLEIRRYYEDHQYGDVEASAVLPSGNPAAAKRGKSG